MMALSHLLLQVRDLDRSEAFYREELGFTLRQRTELRDARPLVTFQEGLGLTTYPAESSSGTRMVDHIAFFVEGLEPFIARWQAKGWTFEGPVETERYGSSIYLRDPDGNRIELHDCVQGGTR